MKMRVLLTGAAGYIGGLVTAHLADRYDWILTDRRPPADTHGLPFVQADISDMAALRPLCNGVDTVVHLAAASKANAAWDELLPNNIVGVYNVFQAASEAGCQRVVFASSIHAVDGYPKDVQIQVDMPVAPLNLYGATKAWGEALAGFYAREKNLSVLCLRIGWVMPRDHPGIVPGRGYLDAVITHADLIRLIAASLDAPDDLRFGIFHGISNNRRKRLDVRSTCQQLHYDPQDDAFELARTNYSGMVHQWGRRVKRAVRLLIHRE